MKTHHGSCHCGAVTFTATADIESVLECNCSHCSRKGFLLSFIPAEQFELLTGEDHLTEYRFNKKLIAHLFCKTCGVQGFARAKNAEGKDTVALNVRALPDLDISTLTIQKVSGKDF